MSCAYVVCSVQLSGPRGSVTVGESSRLATVQPHDIADGAVHTVRVTYFKFINYDLLPHFTGSSALLPYLIDNGEVCVCVFILCMLAWASRLACAGQAHWDFGCVH